jgi:hypothetical protein
MTQTGGQHSINENVTKDGRIIICEWFNTTLINKDGKAIGVASVCRDITKQKHMELELAKYREHLEEDVFFSACTPSVNSRAPVSGWPTCVGLSLGMAGEPGRKAKSTRAPRFTLRCRVNATQGNRPHFERTRLQCPGHCRHRPR